MLRHQLRYKNIIVAERASSRTHVTLPFHEFFTTEFTIEIDPEWFLLSLQISLTSDSNQTRTFRHLPNQQINLIEAM